MARMHKKGKISSPEPVPLRWKPLKGSITTIKAVPLWDSGPWKSLTGKLPKQPVVSDKAAEKKCRGASFILKGTQQEDFQFGRCHWTEKLEKGVQKLHRQSKAFSQVCQRLSSTVKKFKSVAAQPKVTS